MLDKFNKRAITVLSIAMCLFTLEEVNFSRLQPLSGLAIFVAFGLWLCFLVYPLHPKLKDNVPLKYVDWLLAILAVATCGYVVFQTEPLFAAYWFDGKSLANRAGTPPRLDIVVGMLGLFTVLEATRRSIGWIVPILAVLFMLQAYFGPQLPNWLLPHSGATVENIVSAAYLNSQGVFGKAASVMFQYVFLFVVFGSFLEMSGATQFIIDFAQKVFGRSQGGPALVSVLGSGLMGSLSGSAVANAVTTGAFTIPMMRNAGFPRHVAGGITAAAASGGALVPPVMGAGAYMMLELVEMPPGVDLSFLDIVKAALLPAILYYFSLLVIVHFYSGMLGAKAISPDALSKRSVWRYEAIVFFSALAVLIGLLIMAFSPFRAVTGSLIVILVLTALRPGLQMSTTPRVFVLLGFVAISVAYWIFFTEPMHERSNFNTVFTKVLTCMIVGMLGMLAFGLIHPAWRPEMVKAFVKSAKAGISLVAASACVGIIIGMVAKTGIAGEFSAQIKSVVESNLLLALVGIMGCSLVLGMGVPSVVCYLLMATLMGSLLGDMGVEPLAAHFFIFYFGMMSMVTPPVALAGYAAASIADSPVMRTSFAAFRFSLVGFTLPFMFIYQPSLLLMEGTRPGLQQQQVETQDPSDTVTPSPSEPTSPNAEPVPPGSARIPLTPQGVALALGIACLGIVALAAGLVGFLDLIWKRSALTLLARGASFAAAAMLLSPDVIIDGFNYGIGVNITGALIFLAVVLGVIFLPPAKPRPIRLDQPDEEALAAAT